MPEVIMMRIIIGFVFVLALVSISFSQEFSGIIIADNVDVVKKQLVSKGFTFEKASNDIYEFIGKIAGERVGISLVYTPVSKLVWKLIVSYDRHGQSWGSLENKFDELVTIFTQKYGSPKHNFRFFSSPYERGDGYELTAISADKCSYLYSWDKTTFHISIKIVKGPAVWISYENVANAEKDDDERAAQQKNVF
jgi:hypothetical protein